MLGEGSLRELRDAFTLAEQERDGGLSPHVSPFAVFWRENKYIENIGCW